MKIFSVEQIRALDRATITKEPISSQELMERAASCIIDWIIDHYSPSQYRWLLFCGRGNNGGDGFAVARMLLDEEAEVTVIAPHSDGRSEDNLHNLKRLPNHLFSKYKSIPKASKPTIIIDAIFGTGLSRAPQGIDQQMILMINDLPYPVISVDIPSGLPGDSPPFSEVVVAADLVLTLASPKMSFFFPESIKYVPKYELIDIGLHQESVDKTPTNTYLLDKSEIARLLLHRPTAGHKGTFGHCLTIAGSQGKIGAAILATKAALRSGCGLATLHVPSQYAGAVHASLPEAMLSLDEQEHWISQVELDDHYSSVAIGCGIGQHRQTEEGLSRLLQKVDQYCILDADALNIIAHRNLTKSIPQGSILTPHPGEFKRLFGSTKNTREAWLEQIRQSRNLDCIIILKGSYTKIVLPDQTTYVNPTGNAGMATGGSGDVLTGILNGLCARGYSPRNAAIVGTYLHGLAGDLAAQKLGQESMIASDIIAHLPHAFATFKVDS